jgi:hypothetical protein
MQPSTLGADCHQPLFSEGVCTPRNRIGTNLMLLLLVMLMMIITTTTIIIIAIYYYHDPTNMTTGPWMFFCT